MSEIGLLTFWKIRPLAYSVFHLKRTGKKKKRGKKPPTQTKPNFS